MGSNNRSRAGLCAALVVFAGLTGCATITDEKIAGDELAKWKGKHISQVIKQQGPPARTVDTGDGKKIYVWSNDRSFQTSESCTSKPGKKGKTYTSCSGGDTVQRACEISLFTNTRGTVTDAGATGCYAWEIGGLRF